MCVCVCVEGGGGIKGLGVSVNNRKVSMLIEGGVISSGTLLQGGKDA